MRRFSLKALLQSSVVTNFRVKKVKPILKFSSTGFTLVELLIVVAILAILAAVGFTVFGNVQRDTRDSRRKADIDAITKAMEVRYNSNTGMYSAIQADWFSSGAIPRDPTHNGCESGPCYRVIGTITWGYVYPDPINRPVPGTTAGTTFYTCARLESGSGGNFSDMWFNSPQDNGSTYCKRSQR